MYVNDNRKAMTKVIHKLNMTPEAVFDIFDCLDLKRFNKRTLKTEVEYYLWLMSVAGKLPWYGYFHLNYIDDDSGMRLKLFMYRGIRVGLMQYWDLKGVCLTEGWTQDKEDNGQIRTWIETKIMDMSDREDWVIRLRVHDILSNTKNTVFKNVLGEVRNEFECKRDKEAAERLAFLQSAYFDFRNRRIVKKN